MFGEAKQHPLINECPLCEKTFEECDCDLDDFFDEDLK